MIGHFSALVKALVSYLIRTYEITKFKSFGKDSYIGHQCIFTFPTIEMWNHTFIGSRSVCQSTHGRIVIGNHDMFGPGVNINGGNHIMDRIGVYMDEVYKEPGSDAAVIIEDDVWIGANAMILFLGGEGKYWKR